MWGEMEAENFVKTSRELLPTGQGRPRGTNLRRAVSTTYYAMFHCLARSCADTLIGKSGRVRGTEAWARTYRALDHNAAKRRCQDTKGLGQFPESTRIFAKTFAQMQEQRHRADYAPDAIFRKSEVNQRINDVEDVINNFEREPRTIRRAFAAYILFKGRTG